jgi:hypothetical protein
MEFHKVEEEFDLSGMSMCMAIPCYSGFLPLETGLAIAQTAIELRDSGVQLDILSERENGIITSVRNRLIYRYLTESKAEYLFWIDDDIIFTPQDVFTILALASRVEICAATYPSRKEPSNFFLKYINDKSPEFDETYGLIKTKGLGMGFICMHRSVVERVFNDAIDEEYEDAELRPRDLFKCGRRGRKYWGEDMTFLTDLYDKYGYISYVHPWVNLKHVGRKDYNDKLMSILQKE